MIRQKSIIIFLIIFFGVLFFAKVSLAATYYVFPTGNDSNPGTETQPWRTIQKAANTMVAGDTVMVNAGTYNERVNVSRSGTSGTPITFRAEGTVEMKGFYVSGDYVKINGFYITGTDCHWRDGWGIYVDGSNCVIENNYVYDCPMGGIVTGTGTSNCIVKNNKINRCGYNSGVEVQGANNLIENNEIWDMIQFHPKCTPTPPSPPTGNVEDADGIRFFGSGHIIRKNYIHDINLDDPWNVDPHSDCFQTWGPAYDITIEQNFCENENLGMQTFMIEEIRSPVRNLTIKNNILGSYQANFKNCENSLIVHNIFLTYPSFDGGNIIMLSNAPQTTVKNNIFYDQSQSLGAWPFHADSASQIGLDYGYNCIYRTTGSPRGDPTFYVNHNDLWGVNPRFVNPAQNDYHLQSTSPAINAGATISSVINDYDGNSRPQGSAYDIGAYEYVSGTPPPDTTPPAPPSGVTLN